MFPKRDSRKVQQVTLCFLVKGKRVLLAMKKRGFGKGFWNGVGGKIAADETVVEAASREVQEEIGVEIEKATSVGLLHFYFLTDPAKKDWNQDAHVFLVKKWKGIPSESEEMKPRWFDFENIPYEKMWSDDPYWLPNVLNNRKVEAWFKFDENNTMSAYKLKNVGKSRKVFGKR